MDPASPVLVTRCNVTNFARICMAPNWPVQVTRYNVTKIVHGSHHLAYWSHVVTCTIGGRHGVSLGDVVDCRLGSEIR